MEVFGLPLVVAVNRFPTDTEEELQAVIDACRTLDVRVALSEVWGRGGEGGIELAEEVSRLCEQPAEFRVCYDLDEPIEQKLRKIVQRIYGGADVAFTGPAEKQAASIRALGLEHLPVCVAKTQYSFSDDPQKLGAPEGFNVTVRQLRVSAGAGFIVALTGDIMTLPGLRKVPAAECSVVGDDGRSRGVF